MEKLIEKYKNFDIKFDTKHNRFVATSIDYGVQLVNQSYPEIKLSIDEETNKHSGFEGFYANLNEIGCYDKIKIIGINQNNKYICIDENGVTRDMSYLDMTGYYFVYNPQNDDYMEEIAEIKEQIQHLESRIEELDNKLDKTSLLEYLHSSGHNNNI